MAYLGTPIDTTNQFQSLQGKRFSGDGSTTAFTLDVAPGSTLDIEVYVENVRQDPNSAYSLSGTTLTFSAAPASGTNNIYVIHQAKAVGTITAGAGTVNADSFDNTVISGHDALAAEPADTDEFLVSDAGTIKRVDYSLIKPTNTPSFSVYRDATLSISNSTDTIIVFDTEDFDTDSAYNVSDGKFTVPSGKGGKYFFHTFTRYQYAAETLKNFNMQIHVNNSRVAQTNLRGAVYTGIACSTLANLSAGDYVQVKVQHDIGSATEITSIAGYNEFSGFKLI